VTALAAGRLGASGVAAAAARGFTVKGFSFIHTSYGTLVGYRSQVLCLAIRLQRETNRSTVLLGAQSFAAVGPAATLNQR
jgi:hypothetical protein